MARVRAVCLIDYELPMVSGLQGRFDQPRPKAWGIGTAHKVAQGTEPDKSLVTITEESSPTGVIWRINYGPRDYFRKRGGDLIVIVDETKQTVQRILRGQ